MAHDSHHEHSTDNKIKTSFSASFWLIIILVGLFIAALNFIQAETDGAEHDHGATRLLLKTHSGHTTKDAVQSPNAAAKHGTHEAGEPATHEPALQSADSAHPAEHTEHSAH
jgi:hypothetical protein